MGCGARMTSPPNASPIAWWPRQTPSTGMRGPNSRITSSETPACSGRPGPGEMTTREWPSARSASSDASSLRRTTMLRAQLAQVLDQVVGERIVVVDDEDHAAYNPVCASSSARNIARALSLVSSYSAVGFESATMPAPAWM